MGNLDKVKDGRLKTEDLRKKKEEKELHKYVSDMSIIGEIIEAKRAIAQKMLLIKNKV